MSKIIGKSRAATTVAVLLGLLCAFSPLPLRADVLNASDQALAAMMGSAESDVLFFALTGGPFTGTLAFNSQFTVNSFQYSLAAGSLYNGVPITLTTTGALTSPDTWTVVTTGSISGSGTTSFSTSSISSTSSPSPSGVFRPSDNDGTDTESHEHKPERGSDGHLWQWTQLITWTVNPDDSSDLLSREINLFENLDTGGLAIKFGGTNERHRYADDGGKWQIGATEDIGNGGVGVFIHGAFDPAGNGGFVAEVVPEPSYTVLLASALAGLCMWRCRAFRPSRSSLAS